MGSGVKRGEEKRREKESGKGSKKKKDKTKLLDLVGECSRKQSVWNLKE